LEACADEEEAAAAEPSEDAVDCLISNEPNISNCKRLIPTSNGLKNGDWTFTEPRDAGCCAFAAAPHASIRPVTSTLVHLQAEIFISITSSQQRDR
jgi:hypothetical protein